MQGPAGDGVVAMLFTDIEGSTRLAKDLGAEWASVLAVHGRLVIGAIEEAGGNVEKAGGDSFFATFVGSVEAVAAAAAAQRSLRAHAWPARVGELRVRMGVHVGAVKRHGGELVGVEIHRAARIGAAARGGQVLLSADARRQLASTVAVDDLGLHRLKDFPEPQRLYHLRVHEDRGADAFLTPATLDARPTNLPVPGRGLVGREEEVLAIRAALAEQRLVTLTGLGGVGKTHLALDVARGLLDEHPNGVWLVRADQLSDVDELIPALAAALHVRDLPGAKVVETLAERLSGAPALVVFDNLEHLRSASAVVADFLGAVADVRVLATSRAPLRVAGEHRIVVAPLDSDGAAELFSVLARETDRDVDLSDRDAVLEVCARVNGLPLGLELAAAQLRMLTPRDLAGRLGGGDDLRTVAVAAPERQRSLRATAEWSVSLLSPDARRLFARLAVFVGPVSLDVIEAVCGGDLDVVEAGAELVDFALLQRSAAGLGLAPALREFARERRSEFGEVEALERRRAEAVTLIAERVGTLTTATLAENRSVESLFAESLAAAGAMRSVDGGLHARLVVAYAAPWTFIEGRVRRALEETALAVAEAERIGDPDLLARTLLVRANVLPLVGEASQARDLAERAVAIATETSPREIADRLTMLSMVRGAAGALTEARAAAEEATASARHADHSCLLRSLAYLAQATVAVGDLNAAAAALDEAEALADQLPDSRMADMLPNTRGGWALASGDAPLALAGYSESLRRTITRDDVGLALWDAAGAVAALAALPDPAACLEMATLLSLAAAEQGIDVDTLLTHGGTVTHLAATSRSALHPEAAATIAARADAVPPGDRLARMLAVAAGAVGGAR